MEDNIIKGSKALQMYEEVKAEGRLLYEVMVGSHSYGLNVETSDEDFKFIYIDRLEDILSGNATTQINVTDDYVGYEIGRYLELLRKQNPNIIEILYTDEKFIKHIAPVFELNVIANRDNFLSNKVMYSFGEYAATQIKKAQGTNKKFMNPMDKERKSILDFCWVGNNQGSISLKDWIHEESLKYNYLDADFYIPEWIFGCVSIDHMKNCYHLFMDTENLKKFWGTHNEIMRDNLYAHRKYNGIEDKDGVQIKLSSTLKEDKPVITFYCNIEGFSKYCKDYLEYWKWVEARNVARFVENSEPGMNYDRKNMMHCHRLLDMAIEILSGDGVNVFRKNREELLHIRQGNSTYQELVDKAEIKKAKLQELYQTSLLPSECPKDKMDFCLLELRKQFYQI